MMPPGRALKLRLRPFEGRILVVLLMLAAAPAVRADSPGPPVQGEATQELRLEPGWNWIGLYVYPSSRKIADILRPAMQDAELVVKDGQGRHFIPAFDIFEITEWDWRQGYMVNVSTPVTITVAGALIVASATAIPLDRGWSLVPFLGQEPVPIEHALASLGGDIRAVRDAAGRVWHPGSASPALETLEPGQAYQIRLRRAATLVYGIKADEGSYVVRNKEELLALSTAGLAPGHVVTMLGYYAPGDGGGGRFTLVDQPAYVCDPGLVLCPLDQLGPIVTEATVFSESQGTRRFTVSRPPVAFGTLTLTLKGTNLGGSPWILSIPDAYMHGTTYMRRDAWTRTFDHGTGAFREHRDPGGRPMGRYLRGHLGSGWSVAATFEYRPIVGPLRWMRTHDVDGRALPAQGQVWDARRFGCRSHADAPYFDNTNCLNWAMVLAKYTNQRTPERVAEIRLTRNGSAATTFYYLKSIQVADGLALTGDAGAELVTEVDEFGNVFHPVRRRPDAVTLKVLPEAAEGCSACSHVFDHIDMQRPFGDPYHRPPTPAVLLGNSATAIHPESGAATWAVRDLVIDGNFDHQNVFANRFTANDRESFLRNSNAYSGIAQTNHGGKDIRGQRLTIEGVFATRFGSAAIITGLQADTTFIRNVSTGNTLLNHGGYLLSAIDAENLSVHGRAWGYLEIHGGRIRNLVADRLEAGMPGAAVFGWRGGDFDRVRDCPSTRPCGTLVEGMYVDLEGSNRSFAASGIGPGIQIRDIRILTRSDARSAGLWVEGGNGFQRGRYHDLQIENVNYFVRGAFDSDWIIRNHHLSNSHFRHINVTRESEGSFEWASCIQFDTSDRGLNSDPPHEVVYDGFGDGGRALRCNRLGHANFTSEGRPHRFFLLRSRFENGDPGVVRGFSGSARGTGRIASVCETDQPCARSDHGQLFLDDVTIRAGTNRSRDGELFFEVARFRNVVDPETGARSEDRGSFTCNGQSEYSVQTNLFWRPHATRGRFDVAGGPAVANVEFVNSAGRTVGPSHLGADERDARRPIARIRFSSPCPSGTRVEWEAAVSRWLDERGNPVEVPEWYRNR